MALLLLAIVSIGCQADRSAAAPDPIEPFAPSVPLAIQPSPIPAQPIAPARPAAAAPSIDHRNPFGLLLGSENLSDQHRVDLIKAMGVTYFRPWYVTVEDWTGACPDPACDLALNAGLKLILTVRNNAAAGGTTPASDPAAYRQTLGDVLDKYQPEVLIVENEESSDQYWAGTPDDYSVELKAACEVAHSRNIRCANGGLASQAIGLLVWADYIDRGMLTEACTFVQHANGEVPVDLCRLTAANQMSDVYQSLLAKSRQLIKLYQASGQDYLNIHWYISDKAALSEAVTYLQRATNLPVMSNEMGQRDQSPEVVEKLLSAALDLKLPYVIWFSLDRDSFALQNDDGSLRANGETFRNFMQSHYQSIADLPPVATPMATRIAPIPTFKAKPAPVAASSDLTFTQVLTDVTYCTADDSTELKMDMYFPIKPAGPAPAIMFVHGGGWVAGTKTGTPGMSYFLELARRGYLVTSIDYRLAPTYTFPANIQDVKCAVRSLRAHAQEYNIDPNRIGAWGASAGGHLVALLGTSDQSAGWDVGQYLDQSSRVQVVVDMFGISDLTQEYVIGNVRGLDRMVFRADLNSDILKKASPTTYITPDDPPFLILHGDMDNTVPITQSQILHDALRAGGVSSTYIPVHNAGHGFGAVGGPIDPPYPVIARTILNFFDQYLR
jgi:acetyl esterase/lipase